MQLFEMCRQRRSVPPQEWCFVFFTLFGAAISVVTIIFNLLLQVDFSFNYKWIGLSAFFLAAAELYARSICKPLVLRLVLYVLCVIILPMAWLNSAGLNSPSIIYSILILIMVQFVLPKWEGILLSGVIVLVSLVLVYLSTYHPSLFKTLDPHTRLMDWILNLPLLVFAMSYMIFLFTSAYIRQNDKLTRLAKTDYLTGLYNKQSLVEILEHQCNLYHHQPSPLSLLILDIDYFKAYNDKLGHLKGDECLKKVAAILKSSVIRKTDLLFRFGGEEFVVLLLNTSLEDAREPAERIMQNLLAEKIVHPSSDICPYVTISIGAACIDGLDNPTPQTLLDKADQALYTAKANGRNHLSLAV